MTMMTYDVTRTLMLMFMHDDDDDEGWELG
jgi:hypothetical protein